MQPPRTRADVIEVELHRPPASYRATVRRSGASLKATLRVRVGALLEIDSVDLHSARNRTAFARRASEVVGREPDAIEADLRALIARADDAQAASAATSSEAAPMSESLQAEALELLRSKTLLQRVMNDLDVLGCVGETSNKPLLYLVAVSRKLPDPMSAVILSRSAAGKSGLASVIEESTPPEDVVSLSRLSAKSLYYMEPGALNGKLVVIEERYGSLEADYSIRVLQSRKALVAAVPERDASAGGLRTKVFTVEARAAFIEATTASRINHENATRCFELAMDETNEQTARIHARQRFMRTAGGVKQRQKGQVLKTLLRNAQRLLEPLPVVIPYAERLTFPSQWLRTRRDHERFLNLIEASALLHQFQREREEGAVVASQYDYRVAYDLGGAVLRDALGSPSRRARDTLVALTAVGGDHGSATRRQLMDELGAPDSSVRRWLRELVDGEYVEVDAGSGREPARYQVTGREPAVGPPPGLLSPDELESRL